MREGFISDLLKNFASNKKVDSIIYKFVKDVEDGEVDSFMNSLQSLLADVPYSHIPDKELHYENLMYLIMKLMGCHVHTEYTTSDGRIDMIVKTKRFIYVMEFKLRDRAEEAMAQIRDKEYYLPFLKERRKIILIGASFDSRTHRLANWEIESVE